LGRRERLGGAAAGHRVPEAPVTGFHVVVVPLGRLDAEEVEAASVRLAKVLRQPVELREPLHVPRASEDAARAQHRAALLLASLREEVKKLRPGRLVGGDDPAAKPPLRADAFLFVTDVDLFTAQTPGVFAALNREGQAAVVSVRRLREAFYRRKADPNRQRARLVKEMLRMAGRLRGLPECADPKCALAGSKAVPDLDTKAEALCRVCSVRFFEGKMAL
jgi:predicted Zn-dependent protease